MVKHKKCCVCLHKDTGRFYKALSFPNLKIVFTNLSDVNEESLVCSKHERDYRRKFPTNIEVSVFI